MSEEYRLLFAPDLGVETDEFVTAWNAEPECTAAGAAQKAQRGPESFEFDMASAGLGALVVAASTLSKDLIVDLVKRALSRADAREAKRLAEEIVLDQVPDQKTGLPLLIVRKKVN